MMKKVNLLMVIVAAAGFVSCTAQSPKAEFKNEVDSLSYSFGLAQTNGLMQYLVMQRGIDTTYMSSFAEGVLAGATKEPSAKDKAYQEGLQIGQMISESWIPGVTKQIFGDDSTAAMNKANILAGFIEGALGTNKNMTIREAQEYFETTMQTIKDKILAEQYAPNIEAGEKFLAENKTKEGVVTTPSGLQYKVIKQGKGAVPTETSRVKINYRGTLLDGTEFDSSYKRGKPTTFTVNQLIKGWTEALTMMPVGSKWELYIPQDLAYGSRNQGQIKPFSTLIFEVELIEIEK